MIVVLFYNSPTPVTFISRMRAPERVSFFTNHIMLLRVTRVSAPRHCTTRERHCEEERRSIIEIYCTRYARVTVLSFGKITWCHSLSGKGSPQLKPRKMHTITLELSRMHTLIFSERVRRDCYAIVTHKSRFTPIVLLIEHAISSSDRIPKLTENNCLHSYLCNQK